MISIVLLVSTVPTCAGCFDPKKIDDKDDDDFIITLQQEQKQMETMGKVTIGRNFKEEENGSPTFGDGEGDALLSSDVVVVTKQANIVQFLCNLLCLKRVQFVFPQK